jgi:hypothetical protein
VITTDQEQASAPCVLRPPELGAGARLKLLRLVQLRHEALLHGWHDSAEAWEAEIIELVVDLVEDDADVNVAVDLHSRQQGRRSGGHQASETERSGSTRRATQRVQSPQTPGLQAQPGLVPHAPSWPSFSQRL